MFLKSFLLEIDGNIGGLFFTLAKFLRDPQLTRYNATILIRGCSGTRLPENPTREIETRSNPNPNF